MSSETTGPEHGRYVAKNRLEAFSDGVFAIAVTLLVLDLAIGDSGSALHRVLNAWPFYLAYLVSFLTIGAVFVAMYGLTLLVIRIVLFALDEYCRREHLYAPARHGVSDEEQRQRRTLLPVVGAYGAAILIGIALPPVAVGLYCVLAVFLVIPCKELLQPMMNA